MKNLVVAALVASIAVGSGLGAFAASRTVTTTVKMEVTVWQRLSDGTLYLSTRPEGGRWTTHQAPLDMSALSRSGRFRQGSAIAVGVPVTIEVEVPGEEGSTTLPPPEATPTTGPIHVEQRDSWGNGTHLNEATGLIWTEVTIRGETANSFDARQIRFICHVGSDGKTWLYGGYEISEYGSGFYYQVDGGEWVWRRVTTNDYGVSRIENPRDFWGELVAGDSLRIGADSRIYSTYDISWLRSLSYRWNIDHCGEY